MDLLDIVYHLSHSHFTAEEENELNEIIKMQGKEYLYDQSFGDVKEKILKLVSNESQITSSIVQSIIKVLEQPCDNYFYTEMLHNMRNVIDLLYKDNKISKSEHCTIDAWTTAKEFNL